MTSTAAKDKVAERVIEALIDFGADPAAVTPDAELDSLEIDSLDLVELGQIVEDEYGTRIKGKDLESVHTVGDAIELVVSRIQ